VKLIYTYKTREFMMVGHLWVKYTTLGRAWQMDKTINEQVHKYMEKYAKVSLDHFSRCPSTSKLIKRTSELPRGSQTPSKTGG